MEWRRRWPWIGETLARYLHTAQAGSRGVLLADDFGAHVLLLMDGHAVNEPWSSTAYYDRGAGIPLELIDHIEIILGPGSVLYGSNAMLGIVNVVTKRAKNFSGAHLVLDSQVPINLRAALGYGREFKLWGEEGEVVFEVEHFQQQGPTLDFGSYRVDDDPITGNPVRYPPSSQAGSGVGWATTPTERARRLVTCD